MWDFAGIDHYQEDAAQPVEANEMWTNTYAFYAAKGMKIALGEWGNRGTDAAAATDMTSFYDFGIRSGGSGKPQVIGYAYFDSDLNSPNGGWTLQGAPLDGVPPSDGASHVAPGERDGVLTVSNRQATSH